MKGRLAQASHDHSSRLKEHDVENSKIERLIALEKEKEKHMLQGKTRYFRSAAAAAQYSLE